MAVKLDPIRGLAYIPVGIDITGGHFQFLIEISAVDPQLPKNGLHLFPGIVLRVPGEIRQLLNLVQPHNFHSLLSCILVTFYHRIADFARFCESIAINIAVISC